MELEQGLEAIVAAKTAELRALLKRTPELALARFERERLVEAIPHQIYAGDTLLHVAAAATNAAAAKALVAAGFDVRWTNRRGAQPLHYACDPRPGLGTWKARDQEELIGLLLAHGADADATDKAGMTPLHRAVRARSPGAVRVLLKGGAAVRAKAGRSGSTPLHLALTSSGASGTAGQTEAQVDIVALLLSAGAKLSDVDGKGRAAGDLIRGAALRNALEEAGVRLAPDKPLRGKGKSP